MVGMTDKSLPQPPKRKAPEDPDTIAAAIVKISEAMTTLVGSGLNRKAIVILTSHASGVTQGNVRRVIDGLEDLSRQYCANWKRPK